MRLLISTIPYDKGKSGISVYTREVVRQLAAQGHELTHVTEPGESFPILGGQQAYDNKLQAPSSKHQALSSKLQAPIWTKRPILSMAWHLFFLPFWIRRHRKDFDGFVICAANRRVCAFYPLPTVATVHDLANFHIRGKYSRSRMFYLAHILPHFAKKAQHLVAVSGATKNDMVEYWHCREEDVTVLYNGLTANSKPQAPSSPLQAPSSKLQTLLYISRIEHPGKNHLRLIEAYSKLPRALAEAHPLVIAGADWKDADAVHEAAAKSPHADLIRFTGFVANEDMPRLWEEAGFYVFPSLFEGFGLSLVEAMAKGIPCASSNNGSLGEIASDVAITFNPESVDEIAEALEKLLTESQPERDARVARGLEWVKKFSWADHAKGIAKLVSGKGDGTATARLFGIPVARVTEAEAVERIIKMASRHNSQLQEDNKRTTTSSKLQAPSSKLPFFVATLNVDFVANAVSGWPFGGNGELWSYLKNADFVTADGMPIVLLSRLLRRRIPERVTGADMVPAICRRAAAEGLKVYVLGGDKEAVEEAFEKLGGPQSSAAVDRECTRDSIKIAGIDPAFVKLDEDQPEIVERINAAKPDILFVALGNPKQELWMGRNAAKLDVGVMIGIGGTFNFIAGRVKRAPKWVQKSGLEWIYRIIQEPGRLWRRYAYGLVKFSWLSLLHLLGGYRDKTSKGGSQ